MKKRMIRCLGIITILMLCSGCSGNNIQKDVNQGSQKQVTESMTQANEKSTQKEKIIKGTIKEIPDFYSPELDTDNIVRIYLPPNYEVSEEKYPVIYMFDGQNLFDSSTATYQKEWHIDETLDDLYEENQTKGIIVVGVDSVSSSRNQDYNLYLSDSEGGGEGKVLGLCDFYANTLKKYIDEHYRTLDDREHTAIIGSSYGAVASVCTSIQYPKIYGYTGMFSYCDNQNPEKMTEYIKDNMTADLLTDNRIFFYTGTYDFAYESTTAAYEIAQENGLENILYVSDDGQHDEYSWGDKFGECLKFFQWIE